MKLYLMQHGKAVSKEQDPARPLSREGVEQIQASARAIQQLGLAFELIVCSPKRRSHQTAALVAETIRYPYSDIFETDKIEPKAEPTELLQKLSRMIGDKVLVVGHLPHLSRLVSHLLDCERELVRFENGCLVCLEQDGDTWLLASVLTPAQLRRIK